MREWSNSLPSIVAEDERRVATLNKIIEIENLTNVEDVTNVTNIEALQDRYYSLVSLPLQSFCTVGKFFGGYWFSVGGCQDGNKFVCLDKLFSQIQSGKCLIYSFGISGDWSFEEALANLGCVIRTFDPTIDGNAKPKTEKVFFNHLNPRPLVFKSSPLTTRLWLTDKVFKYLFDVLYLDIFISVIGKFLSFFGVPNLAIFISFLLTYIPASKQSQDSNSRPLG